MRQKAHGHFLTNLPREREVFNISESINVWPLFTFIYAVCLIEKASLWWTSGVELALIYIHSYEEHAAATGAGYYHFPHPREDKHFHNFHSSTRASVPIIVSTSALVHSVWLSP